MMPHTGGHERATHYQGLPCTPFLAQSLNWNTHSKPAASARADSSIFLARNRKRVGALGFGAKTYVFPHLPFPHGRDPGLLHTAPCRLLPYPVTGCKSTGLEWGCLAGLLPPHRGPFYSKSGPWTSRLLEMHNLGPAPPTSVFLNWNLHFYKMPKCFVRT